MKNNKVDKAEKFEVELIKRLFTYPEQDRQKIINDSLEEAGRILLMAYTLLDLKTYITGKMTNRGSSFELTFKRIDEIPADH